MADSCAICGQDRNLLGAFIAKRGAFFFCTACITEAFELVRYDQDQPIKKETEHFSVKVNVKCFFCDSSAQPFHRRACYKRTGAVLCYQCVYRNYLAVVPNQPFEFMCTYCGVYLGTDSRKISWRDDFSDALLVAGCLYPLKKTWCRSCMLQLESKSEKISRIYERPFVDLENVNPDQTCWAPFEPRWMYYYKVMPFAKDENFLYVAMVNPRDAEVMISLQGAAYARLGLMVLERVCDLDSFEKAYARCFPYEEIC